jgi:hypothetical protein
VRDLLCGSRPAAGQPGAPKIVHLTAVTTYTWSRERPGSNGDY